MLRGRNRTSGQADPNLPFPCPRSHGRTSPTSARSKLKRILHHLLQRGGFCYAALMEKPDYSEKDPLPEETALAYSERLEAEGHEEYFIRKGLAYHFNMSVAEMGEFFEQFPEARLRHIQLLSGLHPNRTEYSLIVKVSRNLGVSRDAAERWVHAWKFWRSGRVDQL